jgi:hypothetical protein
LIVTNPSQFTPIQRWLSRWWPSTRLGRDPLADMPVEDRYVPVSIANWKLTPWMADELLRRRVPRPLTFSEGERLTVVVPYRDRGEHLRQLLPALTAELEKQRIRSRILIVEQESGRPFNRGKLINVGVQYAAAGADYFCIHDVDAIPIVGDYRCPSQPLRLVTRILRANGRFERTPHYFSGVISVRKEQMFAAGGFSNEYWGWGKEDDDFFFRLLLADYVCYYDRNGEYCDLANPPHQQVARNGVWIPAHLKRNRRRRSMLLRGQMDPSEDGIHTLQYEVLLRTAHETHETILVRV